MYIYIYLCIYVLRRFFNKFFNLLLFFLKFFLTPENTMNCFEYKIQLWENNKKVFFLKTNLQTTEFKNWRAQASEADYYIVIIHHQENRHSGAIESLSVSN